MDKTGMMMSLTVAASLVGCCSASNLELEWTDYDPLPIPASDQTATAIGDFIYIVGGCVEDQVQYCSNVTNAALRFNPATGEYLRLADAPRERYRHVAVGVGTTLYLLGGRTLIDNLITEIDTYDTVAGTWSTSSTSWADATSDLGAFVLDDTTIVLAGGYDSIYNTLTRLQVLDVSGNTPTWVQTATQDAQDIKYGDLTTPRGDFAAVLVGDEAYAFGGWNADFCSALDTTEKFDVTSRNWTAIDAPLLIGRGDKAFGVHGDVIFALGGETKDTECELSVPVRDVETFSVANQEWSEAQDLPEHRFRFPAATFGNTIYAFGGQEYFNETCGCYRVSGAVAGVEIHDEDDDDDDDDASAASTLRPVQVGTWLVAGAVAMLARP